MKKTLVILAHPNMKESRLNKEMINSIKDEPFITINDLYSKYKSFDDIDVKEEQKLLLEHDRIVFQFPLYWFSSPGLLKDWQDKVLEYGFAFGSDGYKLANKEFKIAITIGSPEYAYQSGAYIQASINEILKPFEITAKFIHLTFTSTFKVYRALKITDEELKEKALEYRDILLKQDWSTSLFKYLAEAN
ncbi:NAD(P)H dehydrogenase (quinone) [Arcobacter nitrofigilis DSM 7299]|uniref:NAD(P)H dehydrogenase (Quinone) n=1 Tax=Arcobacter nitrofigilis (strain ATCC 33309 / DSM 7299 / CCUG 15893 / LMG 7604 / NCTC 12251 / CI) TaxID=572480 RepID=D5V0M7_ARCNC|nr:NAD(P)H-dependent oxidoreductase [Arcobacter nitrofigilis]ADG93839.1 NAD(P)H dehydrogenase (quinone) [Arcobacter nitrofigilis DSM 7299]